MQLQLEDLHRVYLEDYHVGPFHPLAWSNFVTCDDLRWDMADEYSVQTVGVANLRQTRLRRLQEVARCADELPQRRKPTQGAVWLTYYPTMMVEWYPHVLVVSNMYPQGRRKRSTWWVLLPRRSPAFEREFIEAQQAATWRPAIGTAESASAWMPAAKLCSKRRQQGRPLPKPMEDGMQHFHGVVSPRDGLQD